VSEMIERVARALSHADDGDSDVLFDYYLELARAAIMAMREATPEMIAAGDSCVAEGVWTDMIDEALSSAAPTQVGEA
jgi:hypothetical protein